MKTKNIYMIRHGQTDYNKRQMVQGRGIDSSLNEVGQEQASKFYDFYKDMKFDKIYTSALKRTQESVQKFIDDGLPFESLSGLDEISWGDHEGMPYDKERHQDYLHGLEQWRTGNQDFRVANGESPNEVVVRQKEAFEYILNNEAEETILIATHGRAMRILLCWVLGKPLEDSETFEHSNLCLYKLKYDGNKMELVGANNTDHLK